MPIKLTFIAACSKSGAPSPPDGFTTAAETKAQFNNTNFGVYKGEIIGSTGTMVFRINNGDTIVKAYLSVNGVKDTSGTVQRAVLGQPLVNLRFTAGFAQANLRESVNCVRL